MNISQVFKIVFAIIILFLANRNVYAQDFNKNFADSLNPLYETKLLRLADICIAKNDSINFLMVSDAYLRRYHEQYQLINFLFGYKRYNYKNIVWQKEKNKAVKEFLSGLPIEVDTSLFLKLMLIKSEDQTTRLDPSLHTSIDTSNVRHLKTVDKIIKSRKDSKKYLTEEGMDAMFLVVQHIQDTILQRGYMDTIKRWARLQDISPGDYAIYIDRTLIKEGKQQLYGSQFHVDGPNLIIYPVERRASLDERRETMHMIPMKDYIIYVEMFEKKKVIF